MKINNLRGDLTDISAEKEALSIMRSTRTLHIQEKHRAKEAARVAEMKKQTDVLKFVAQLPRPVKKDATETSITITVDRSGKFSDNQVNAPSCFKIFPQSCL